MARSYFVGKKQTFCRKELVTDTHCYRHRRENNIFNNSFFFFLVNQDTIHDLELKNTQ